MPESMMLGQKVAEVDSLNRVARGDMVEEEHAKNLGPSQPV